MQKFCSIRSQLLQLFPRMEFEQAVRDHKAEYHTRGFASWGQFVALLFCNSDEPIRYVKFAAD